MHVLAQVEQLADLTIPWDTIGIAGMFAALWWMIATGRLVTRREHEATKVALDKSLAIQADLTKQNSKLLGEKDLTLAILDSRRAALQEGSP